MQRTVLPSGIRILSERVEGQRSAVSGVWVRTGSRDEPADLNGVTHFLEHLVFKGTPSRTALQIAESFDAIGGDLNAYTTKEFTCFHARTLGDDVVMALETMGDMLTSPRLAASDIESERTVVLEEIAMHEDTPDDIVFDVFAEAMWGHDPIARRVQGSEASVAAMTREQIAAYHGRHYQPPAMVVSAAGDVDHDLLVEVTARVFGSSSSSFEQPSHVPPRVEGKLVLTERDIEQTHLVYGTGGLPRTDDRRWALGVLNTALGGGMSSRLFQKIREEKGLAYVVSSGHQGYTDAGQFSIYAACSPQNAATVLAITREQIEDLLANGPTGDEVERAKGHMRGTLAIAMDDPGAVMSHIGKSELMLGSVMTVEEMMKRIASVSVEQVHEVAHAVLGSAPWSLAVLGPALGADVSGFVGEAA